MKTLLSPFSLALAGCLLSGVAAGEEVELFNGKDLSAWKTTANPWSVAASVALDTSNPKAFQTEPGTGVTLNTKDGKATDIVSAQSFGDCRIQVEFCVPKGSNSGVYVQGRYEIQVLDSHGKEKSGVHDCGAIYERWKDEKGYEGKAPAVNASKAPGEWQTFDITFRAPRFDASGKKIANAVFVKVLHNGQVIHENAECTGPTRGGAEDEVPEGPIRVQGDHGPVAYRSLKVTPMPAP